MSTSVSTPTSSTDAPREAPGVERARRGRGWARSLGVVVLVGVLVAWWWASTPDLRHFSSIGVHSDDLPIATVDGPDSTMLVMPNDPAGEIFVQFDVVNDGPATATVVDVWPDESAPPCFWRPTVRDARLGRDNVANPNAPAVDVADVAIPPHDVVSFWLSGSTPAPPCPMGALAALRSVDVVVSILGRTSTVSVDLADVSIGMTDDLDWLSDSYGVTISPAG